MPIPTPHVGLRGELDDLLEALAGLRSVAARRAIKREVYMLFDLATAKPAATEAASDANGSEPEQTEARLFVEIAHAELSGNGFDPPGRAA